MDGLREPASGGEGGVAEVESSFGGLEGSADLDWVRELRCALEDAPRPEQADRLADRLLSATLGGDAGSVASRLKQRPDGCGEELSRIFYAVCGIAPFLATFFERNPLWLFELLEDELEKPRERGELERRLDAALSAEGGSDPAVALRRFKYFELARITIRDSCDEWVPLSESAVTLRELSALADVLLERALAIAEIGVRESLGPARWRSRDGETIPLAFSVLGLGKLGSEELNYSSDVDLVYVHETPKSPLALPEPEDASKGFAALAPVDYFTRLAQSFAKLVGSQTTERFLYRIDLDLRPQGAQGVLVVSDESLAAYYEAWADTWERAAFMKARPVAGDSKLGWRAIRKVDPMIYRSGMDYAGVESILAMKRKVEEARGGRSDGFNVKIDAGGIRDVEFIAQALQLLHGGRILQIRGRSTQASLTNLLDVGLLSSDDAGRLIEAYLYLRRVENRIQMEDERQQHLVPGAGDALTRLARSMGFLSTDASDCFEAELQRRRVTVQTLFAGTYAEGGKNRILDLFARNVPQMIALPSMREMFDALAEQLARKIDESPEPERALNSLDRFIASIGSRRFYYELLLDRPELVSRLVALFASSKYLANYLSRYPRLIERLFADPDVLLHSREALRTEFEETLRSIADESRDPNEVALDALRIFQHCQVLNVGLLDIAGEIGRAEAEVGLSEVAEVCVTEALRIAERRLATRREGVPEGAFLVVGMGKLGSSELTYGSDLDLIFLYDVPGGDPARNIEAQTYFVTLSQRLMSSLQSPTGEGFCYEIDARLRPSGKQGSLVTSLAALRRYHQSGAAVWERQALLRARVVAGDPRLAEAFATARREILGAPMPEDFAAEVDTIRQRMETELASETRMRRNFKTGRGGLLDVETVVQYLQLRHGREDPALFEVGRVEIQLGRLADRGLLAPEAAVKLGAGWEFLQQLSSRLRMVENRSITELDGERGDLEGLARRLGYAAGGRDRSARRALLADYQRHTDEIRHIYEEILRPASPA